MCLRLKKNTVVFAKTNMDDFDKLRDICKRYCFEAKYNNGSMTVNHKPYYSLNDELSNREALPEPIIFSDVRNLNDFIQVIIKKKPVLMCLNREQLIDDIIKEMRTEAWTLS